MGDQDDTRTVARRLIELMDDGTPDTYGSDRFLELVADNCDWRERSSDPRFSGRQGSLRHLRAGVIQSSQTFVDRHASLEELIVEQENAAAVWVWSAVNRSDGGRSVARVWTLLTVSEGRITRWHDVIAVELDLPAS